MFKGGTIGCHFGIWLNDCVVHLDLAILGIKHIYVILNCNFSIDCLNMMFMFCRPLGVLCSSCVLWNTHLKTQPS